MLDGIGCTHVIYAFAALDNQTYEIVSHDPKFDIEEGIIYLIDHDSWIFILGS